MLKYIPLILCLNLVGCGKLAADASASDAGAGVDTAVNTPTSDHTVDFAAFDPKVSSEDLELYGATSLAVTLNPSKPLVKLAPQDVTGRPAQALVTSDGSICTPEHPFLALPTGELAAGENASLVSIDVAFFGSAVEDPGPHLTGPYFLCFGTRSPDGSWKTSFRQAEILYDAPSNELRAHYVFDDGIKADAVRLLVRGSMRGATPKRITYRTRSAP